jgi:hypothetical protein
MPAKVAARSRTYFHIDGSPLARILPTTRQGTTNDLFGGPQRGDVAGWFVPVKDLIGRAWITYWPPSALGIVQSAQPEGEGVATDSRTPRT